MSVKENHLTQEKGRCLEIVDCWVRALSCCLHNLWIWSWCDRFQHALLDFGFSYVSTIASDFPVSGILCTFRPTWVYFPCLMLQLWALEFYQVSFLGTWNVNERRYLPFWSYCSPLQLFFCINSHATWLPRWVSGNESPCQCGRPERCGFDPWVGKIPWSRKRQPTL